MSWRTIQLADWKDDWPIDPLTGEPGKPSHLAQPRRPLFRRRRKNCKKQASFDEWEYNWIDLRSDVSFSKRLNGQHMYGIHYAQPNCGWVWVLLEFQIACLPLPHTTNHIEAWYVCRKENVEIIFWESGKNLTDLIPLNPRLLFSNWI